MCTSQKPVHGLTQDSINKGSDKELISSIEYVSGVAQYNTQAIHCEMMVKVKPLHFQVDSGATVNTLSLSDVPLKHLSKMKFGPSLKFGMAQQLPLMVHVY